MSRLGWLLPLLLLTACREPLRTPDSFDWQGHRGARAVYPENTVPGFLYALDQGVRTLEMDVVITADSMVVVSHEAFLNHEICLDSLGDEIIAGSDTSFNIFRMKYSDLQYFDCGSRVHPRFPDQQHQPAIKPLLIEVIEAAELHALETNREQPLYNIEIKSRPEGDARFHPVVSVYAELVLNVIIEAGVRERVSIQSFDKRVLRYLHQSHPEVVLVLLEEDERSPQEHIRELGFVPEVYSCHYQKIDHELVEYCHAQGMKVIPWTVNDYQEMQRLIELGVDGIITDQPELLRRFQGRS